MIEGTHSTGPVRTFGKDPPLSECAEPIAIVGMGCRWPGGASDPSKLWDLLAEGRDGFAEFEPEKFNLDGYYHPDQNRPGSLYTRGGYFLQENPKDFDHRFFGITPVEAMTMDPAQRKLLEITYEAFENAGETWESISGSKTGVYVGNFNYDHQLMQMRDCDYPLPYAATGGDVTMLSNRINYVFNLRGPSLTLDTACSSSMYAIHLAVQAIRNGDCDAAIVGGSNLILGPETQILTTKLGAISPSSVCHTFDAAADGYARADGFGVLYIKRTSEALACGNHIRAFIRGTAVNANGRTGGITHPSPDSQQAVIRNAYQNAGGIDHNLTGYFECHGTGTPVGDPLEVAAIGRFFAPGRQDAPLYIGSIKPNLGHSESASGIAGVMKAVLAIEQGVIPPTIGIVTPNPDIDFASARVNVVIEKLPWPQMPIRRASVNSFGYGGANAHCVLDHVSSIIQGYIPPSRKKCSSGSLSIFYPDPRASSRFISAPMLGIDARQGVCNEDEMSNSVSTNISECSDGDYTNTSINDLNSTPHQHPGNGHNHGVSSQLESCVGQATRRLVLLPFSGHDEVSLRSNMTAVADVADSYHLSDLAYTLGSRRSEFSHRAFEVVDAPLPSPFDPSNAKFGDSRYRQRDLGFIFTGQGAQWAGMGLELYVEYEAFRRSIAYQDRILTKLDNSPAWSIRDFFIDPATSSRIHEPQFAQTVCTALQVALVDLLRSWGVKPVVCLGHSSGEIAAAYASGFHTAAESIVLAYIRGQIAASNTREGCMLAVGLGPEDVVSYVQSLDGDVKVAAVNSTESITLSGDAAAISSIHEHLECDGVFVSLLKTGGNAYHSHHMAALGEAYESLVSLGFQKIRDEILNEGLTKSPARWISSVTPWKTLTRGAIGPSYWRQNLESPVLFSQALEVLATCEGTKCGLLCEIGPHHALGGILKQNRVQHGNKIGPCLASLVRGGDGLENMMQLGGNLFLNHVHINLIAVNAVDVLHEGKPSLAHGSLCQNMPHYAYNYGQSLYYENRLNRELRLRKNLRHELLGAMQAGCSRLRPSWRNILRLKDVPWLEDHKLSPDPVFPAAGYLAMAIEAVSQIHNDMGGASPLAGFMIRNVAIESTLRVPNDDYGVEIILDMSPVDMKYLKGSPKWYEFSISSVPPQGHLWTQHCSGIIKTETTSDGSEMPIMKFGEHAVFLSTKRWYDTLTEAGLSYGPTFQALSRLRSYDREKIIAGDVALYPQSNAVRGGELSYPIHPTALDALFQLALVSCHTGKVENIRSAYVPVSAKQLSIYIPSVEDMNSAGQAVAKGELRGLRGSYAEVRLFGSSGRTLVGIEELRSIRYDGSSQKSSRVTKSRQGPYMRLVWKPDITALSNDSARSLYPPTTDTARVLSIFKKLDQLSSYILVDFCCSKQDILEQPHTKHLEKFLAWVRRCIESMRAGRLEHGREALDAPPSSRSKVIDSLEVELRDIVEAKLIIRIYKNLAEIVTGETSGLQVALEQNLLGELYSSGIVVSAAYPQLLRIIDLLAHKEPRMKILEIGGGTGGATRQIMGALFGKTTYKRYASYTFTDVTTSFLSFAEAEFAACNGMIYETLDIQKDPRSQGYQSTYDLIIASQVLHAVSNITHSLQNARKLLKPGGKMVLLELTRTIIAAGLCLGTFPDYWNGAGHDGRGDSPLIERERWHDLLIGSGFSGIDIVLDDHKGSVAMASTILTTAVELEPKILVEPNIKQTVYLIHFSYPHPLARALAKQLCSQRLDVAYVSFAEAKTQIPKHSRVISLVDIGGVVLTQCGPTEFDWMKDLIRCASSLVWLSFGDPISSSRPESGIMMGLLRAIITETPQTRFAHIGLKDDFTMSLTTTAHLILQKEFLLQICDPRAHGDSEYALCDRSLYVSRLVPDRCLNEDHKAWEGFTKSQDFLPMDSQGPLSMHFDEPGLLSSLYFESDVSFLDPLKDDCIEIETKAIGLNMKDLAVATGRFDWNSFSTECAGIVTKIGTAVENVQVGDRVFGAVPGNMGNFIRGPSISVQQIPSKVTFEEAASIPVVYMTAIYAFMHLAHLRRGESVLVHSATGGLGLAALSIARHLGADIFATVGNREKARVLVEEFGISEDHIFSSRELSASRKLMEATQDKGVDVILCSAAGEQMYEMVRCTAPAGRFIEVGRTDIMENGKLNLEVFKRNITFSSFDLGLLNRQKPQLVAELMAQTVDLSRSGIIAPPNHIKTFDVSQIEQAMLHFARGTHIGKVVVTFKDPKSLLPIRPTIRRVSFDPEADYLLIGCLGGLGRSISRWMAERGARHLTFISRSGASSAEAASTVSDLEEMGVQTNIFQTSVTEKSELFAVVKQTSNARAIKGVLHAAMVEGDAPFETISLEQIQNVLAPKVQGTINLHDATLDQPLDFFIMTSSIAAVLGIATQASYAAANSFQDAFARFRVSQGLSAHALALGMISDIGFLEQRSEVQKALMRNGLYGISERDFLTLLEAAFTTSSIGPECESDPYSKAHLLTGLEPDKLVDLYGKGMATEFTWSTDARFASLLQAVEDLSHSHTIKTEAGSVLDKLGDASRESVQQVVMEAIVERLAKLLFLPVDRIDPAHAVSVYGMDSMIAAELRNWLVKTFDTDVSFLELLSPEMKIETLVEMAVARRSQ